MPVNSVQKSKKSFVLSVRNEKGQVGIFVALIFQVIFVFFAMLVNVGLVVHHKINLQQSTDLAAYYGAMKQAEIMNTMAHVNFQIRQAWKLFAWRYRVLGTFGIEHNPHGSGPNIVFPVSWPNSKPRYNPAAESFSCPNFGNGVANGISISDVPFMCMGHNGFADWISGSGLTTETYCRITCNSIDNISADAFKISVVPRTDDSCVYGNCISKDINKAVDQTNATLQKICEQLGPVTVQNLGMFYASYIRDVTNRKQFIYILNKNLGLPESEMLDLDGQKIITGVKNTLINNLTEANAASIKSKINSIETYNGVKSRAGQTSSAEAMLQEITFQRLMFYLIDCEYNSGSHVKIKSIYKPGTNDLDTNIVKNYAKLRSGASLQGVQSTFAANDERANSLGYEKNPWIQVYYGVKATSEPLIPFLPLTKIKLHAISFAKPFGGTIGPWYYKNWPSNSAKSGTGNDLTNRTDINLPVRTVSSLTAAPSLKSVREFLPNYSTYVGDDYSNSSTRADASNKGGLANVKLVGFYHALLANKYGRSESASSKNKTPEGSRKDQFGLKPTQWPRYGEWSNLNNEPTDPTYDPLAADGTKNSYMRDIELTVVSPNQFDVTYYSIDPNFYQTYLERMEKGKTLTKMKANTTITNDVAMPLDFGNTNNIEPGSIPPSPYFSVRNQMQVTYEIFKDKISDIVNQYGGGSNDIRFALDVLATKQSSLLTGWTFLNLASDGYSKFPSPLTSNPKKFTMLFGTCDPTQNPWSEDFGAPVNVDAKLPPVPGNCVTGGRTGYSVKLISSDSLRQGKPFQNIGGAGTSGQILNPVEEKFLQF